MNKQLTPVLATAALLMSVLVSCGQTDDTAALATFLNAKPVKLSSVATPPPVQLQDATNTSGDNNCTDGQNCGAVNQKSNTNLSNNGNVSNGNNAINGNSNLFADNGSVINLIGNGMCCSASPSPGPSSTPSPTPTPTPGPSCVTPPSEMVAWYPGDGNTNNLIVGGNPGVLKQGAGFAAGKVLQAFNLDGDNDLVDIGPGYDLDDLTLDAWVNLSDVALNTNERRVISKDNLTAPPSGATRKGFTLKSSSSTGSNGTGISGHPAFGVVNGGSVDFVSAPDALTAGWHHLAAVRSLSTGRFELYVDGVMVNSVTPIVEGVIDSPVNAVIGSVSEVNNIENFPGQIDEVEIFNRALSAQEIASIYNAGALGKCK